MSVLYNIKKLKSRLQNRGWVSSDILPTKSGNYLCLTNTESGYMASLHYAEKHKAFNAYDDIENTNQISVEYWRDLPKNVKREKRDFKQLAKTAAQKALGLLIFTTCAVVMFMGCVFVTLLLMRYCPAWCAWAWVGAELLAAGVMCKETINIMWKDEDHDSEQ